MSVCLSSREVKVMLPFYIDLLFRVGRLMGTVRSVIVQTEDLLATFENTTGLDEVLDAGLDL
jgi:hypothetical protein